MKRPFWANIVLMWLGWVVVLFAFQELLPARLALARPDYAVTWTPSETKAHSQDSKIYLNDPFLNTHVSWDSEFYLSIATFGYDDPAVRSISPVVSGASGGGPPPGTQPLLGAPPPGVRVQTAGASFTRPLSLNYAFMWFYPYVTKFVAAPLGFLGLSPIATSTLAALLVSILGALGAMLALYDLARDELGDSGGLRAAFYLIIFPTGFFLAQVYTEGLFLGLAFGSLALLKRKRWLVAALLAAGATWTRAVGLGLLIPFAWAWWSEFRAAGDAPRPIRWQFIYKATLVLAPAAAYLIWHYSAWGQAYGVVEHIYFDRELLDIPKSLAAWSRAWTGMFGKNTQWTIYYLLEFGAVLLGLIASLLAIRRYPDLALFSLAVLAVSFFSGASQGMLRYVLAMPVIFIVAARLGKNPAFDRSWSLASVLLMGMTATLFTFDLWAG